METAAPASGPHPSGPIVHAMAARGSELSYSIVVPTKDRHDVVLAALENALAQTRAPDRIVIVDSSERPLAVPEPLRARAAVAGVDLSVLHTRPSTSAQRNEGVRHVESPIVLFLDDDVTIPPAYADTLLRRWEREGLNAFGGIVGATNPADTPGPLARLLRRLLMLHVADSRRARTFIRRSGKVWFVDRPRTEVVVPAAGAGAVAYRTDLARKHPFDERFDGYALGEDLEMAVRLSRDGPILQIPEAHYSHEPASGGRNARDRWYYRGRRETYFRLKRLDRSLLTRIAFAISLVGEGGAALAETARERDPHHVRSFARGVRETLAELNGRRGSAGAGGDMQAPRETPE